MSNIPIPGKSRRLSRYEDEPSDGQLGINEKELNSMNKHIPGKTVGGWHLHKYCYTTFPFNLDTATGTIILDIYLHKC